MPDSTAAPPLSVSTLVAEAEAAGHRIAPLVRRTFVDASPVLSASAGAQVFLKLENLQLTGSFKLRGATNKLLTLTDEQRRAGVVTASSGNHGQGVAYAGKALGIPVVVFVPEGASPAKLDAIRRLGGDVRVHGTDGLDTEIHARRVAGETGSVYVPPYNDVAVIAGQATVGLELREQVPDLDAVVVAVGGGGLISGVAAVLKAARPSVRVIAAQPENSPVMTASIGAGRLLDMASLPTLSDGTSGGIEAGSITFELCRALVDDWVLVSESAIATAMRTVADAHHFMIEGAAGVAVAALDERAASLKGLRVAVVICGGNVGAEVARDVLCRSPGA